MVMKIGAVFNFNNSINVRKCYVLTAPLHLYPSLEHKCASV